MPYSLNRSGDGELSTSGRFVAAGGASVISAVIVCPFDVVKTRLQAQAAQQSTSSASIHSRLSADLVRCSPSCSATSRVSHAAECGRFSSTLDGMQKIVRREGLRALWRGLDASLVMAVPAVGIYMPLYDVLIKRMEGTGTPGPLLAGAAARMVAVLCVAPLELVRTRTQAVFAPQSLAAADCRISGTSRVWSQLSLANANLSGLGRVQQLWRGVTATLARDVPFSAAYWGLIEPFRRCLMPGDGEVASPTQTLAANFAAGALGGASAAAITQPLDVVKTRMQLQVGNSPGMLSTLRSVAREEGLRGLYGGVTPRALKAAPACAIVLASYECMKLAVSQRGVDGEP